MRDDSDADGRREHEAESEQPDRPHVRSQLAKRGEEGGAVEERREHAEEDELRVELELRHARHDADRQAAEDEQDRIRDPERRGDCEHRCDREDQGEGDQAVLELEMHCLPACPAAGMGDAGQRGIGRTGGLDLPASCVKRPQEGCVVTYGRRSGPCCMRR